MLASSSRLIVINARRILYLKKADVTATITNVTVQKVKECPKEPSRESKKREKASAEFPVFGSKAKTACRKIKGFKTRRQLDIRTIDVAIRKLLQCIFATEIRFLNNVAFISRTI
jgi:hypothetical protein